jgi:polysaccharide pyruvyl transferase WcaK-like protein
MPAGERQHAAFAEGLAVPSRSRTPRRAGAPRLLLFGYNGANITGSETRLLAAIEDVRAVLGPSAFITVPTLSVKEEGRYLREDPRLRTVPFTTRSMAKLGRLVARHDIVVLVEGSCYMDTWASALLLAYLWVSLCARIGHKPCLAYAVDAGRLSPWHQRRVRVEASRTGLIITRTEAAASRLRSWGVTAPIEVTADTAFSLQMEPGGGGLLARSWPEAAAGVVGFALVDFYRWPVVFKLCGRARDRYRWPFYFSSSDARRQASEALVRSFAAEADRIVEVHGRSVALLCMEPLDAPLALDVHRRMVRRDRARVFSSGTCTLPEMTSILRGLDALVSSRYHACVLAMAAGVPMVAVGHDLRIKDLFDELRLPGDPFIASDCPELASRVSQHVDRMLADPQPSRAAILQGYAMLRDRAMRNRELLKAFVERCGWS